MKRSLWLLAISRMAGGFCIAGTPEGSVRWVRPVRGSGHVSKQDLVDAQGQSILPLDLVSWDLVRRTPKPPHVEDWLTNFDRGSVIERRPSERERETLLASVAEPTPDAVLLEKKRSLVLVEPDEIAWVSFDPRSYDGSYKVRMAFSLAGRIYEGEARTPGYPCTDLRLRNWGRRFKSRKDLNDRLLRSALGAKRIFLAIGLARSLEGNHWPMVVGFHTCPDYLGEIDLSNP